MITSAPNHLKINTNKSPSIELEWLAPFGSAKIEFYQAHIFFCLSFLSEQHDCVQKDTFFLHSIQEKKLSNSDVTVEKLKKNQFRFGLLSALFFLGLSC